MQGTDRVAEQWPLRRALITVAAVSAMLWLPVLWFMGRLL
jgi:hypothetical protein